MPFDLSSQELKEFREALHTEPTGQLYTLIGFFLTGYGVTEMLVTHVMAVALGNSEYERFDFLVQGMDAAKKVERLFTADGTYCELGPNLVQRLDYFKRTSSSIRNHLSHSWPVLRGEVVYFATIGKTRLPDSDEPYGNIQPPSIAVEALVKEAIWLKAFSDDLLCLTKRLANGEEALEIADPISSLPMPDRHSPLQRGPHAKRRKRARKHPETQG